MASMMQKGWALVFAGAIGAAIAAGGAVAHTGDKMPANPTPAQRAAYVRHDNFEKLGAAFKGLNDELRKGEPNRAAIAAHAKTMSALAQGLPTWFPRGSGVEARPMSEARAEIWTDAAGFTAAASSLRTEVAKLNTVAAGGNVDAIRSQTKATFQACRSCHQKYRQEKKS